MQENIQKDPIRIGWRVTGSFDLPSLRYRALLPILGLKRRKIESKILFNAREKGLENVQMLVVVKAIKPNDAFLVQQAASRGIPVVFDICDNIFAYGLDQKQIKRDVTVDFFGIARYLDAIVTPTTALADIFRNEVPDIPVFVIPDGLFDAETMAAARQRLDGALKSNKSRKGWRLKDRLLSLGGPFAAAERKLNECLAYGKYALTKAALKAGRKSAKAKIVWFGNHGRDGVEFGMLDLLEFRDTLETIALEYNVELVVISNNAKKFDEFILPFKIPSRYIEWSHTAVATELLDASVVVVPSTLSPFSIVKSPNRTVTALQAGVPVVATATPALLELAPHIHLGDPLEGLRRYLKDPQVGKQDVISALQVAEQLFGLDAIGRHWENLADDLLSRPVRHKTAPQPDVLVILGLMQDLDLALPVVGVLRNTELSVEVWVSDSLIEKSPRVLSTLVKENLPFKVVRDSPSYITDLEISASVKAMLTFAETNLNPHRFARRLTERAKAQNVFVATFQHGIENVGLTYSDSEQAIEDIDFAADRIYTWGPLACLHPSIPAQTRDKCVPVGCPKSISTKAADLSDVIPVSATVVGIFENLHWHRYSDEFRGNFVSGIAALASAYPEITFLVKPHHAGLWLTSRYKGALPDVPNLLVASPNLRPWEEYTAPQILSRLSAVITTPSTVALDAVQAGIPVAVLAYDLLLPNYAPLTLVENHKDLIEFVNSVVINHEKQRYADLARAYLAKKLIAGNAAENVALDIQAEIGRRLKAMA